MSYSPGGGSSKISTSTDVTLSNPATGDVLTYNATLAKWQNQAAASVSNVMTSTGGGNAVVASFTQSSGTVTCDLSLGTHFRGTLTANVTSVSFLNQPDSTHAAEGTILFIQPTSGSFYYTADLSAWDWESGAAPTLSPSINTKDRVGYFITVDGTQGTGIFKDLR